MYGEKFARMWGMVQIDRMKAVWAEDLSDLTAAEIRRGLAACREQEWPPTLPQFHNLCRVPLDYEAAFYEASQHYGTAHQWSAPAVYWAAVKMGNEVRTLAYKVALSRWKNCLDWALQNRANETVPPHDQARLTDSKAALVPMPAETRELITKFRRFGKVDVETGEVTQ
jgi:hypothetical protein